jgi:minor extracellular serine protease Vpr
VREGTVPVPRAGEAATTRVIVTLEQPPLAAAGLNFAALGSSRKLNVAALSSRAYLARLEAAQQRAIASLRRAIPEARVSRRFSVILNGLTVGLPVAKLPKLFGLGFVEKVYPSLRYSRSLNRSPAFIGGPQLQALTGVQGDGIRVAVVDDGIDQGNPFMNDRGYSAPPGFPRGPGPYTSNKVIVARSFPGPGSGRDGRLPFDPVNSFHGTHVGGVVAGIAGTTAPDSTVIPEGQDEPLCILASGGCHTTVTGLSGVAPRAWLGNYRVFNVPSPLDPTNCCTANTPEIAAAFESAVRDGMDVINFSGGGPQSDPQSDALIEAVENVARAGVVPVISAGNDRELFGLGSVGSPSTAPSAISAAAVTNGHVFGRALNIVSPSITGPKQIPVLPAAGGMPSAWASDQTLIDVGTVSGGDRFLCSGTLPAGSLNGAIALVSRGQCRFDDKAERAAAAGAIGMIVADDRPGEPNFIIFRLTIPAGSITDLDGARLRSAMASNGGRATVRVSLEQLELDPQRGASMASFSAGGLTAFGRQLKPDISAPGAQILSSTLQEYAGSDFAVLDGTSFSAPHVAGAAALLLQRHPSWSPMQVKSALMSTAGPAFEDTARTREAPVYLQGAGLVRLTEADAPRIFTNPQSISFQYLNVNAGGATRSLLITVTDAGGGAGSWQATLQPQVSTAGVTIEVPGAVTLPAGGQTTFQVVARADGGAAAGDNFGFVVLRQGDVTRRIPYGFLVTRPRLAGAQVLPLRRLQRGDTTSGVDRARAYRYPSAPFAVTSVFGIDKPVDEDGREQVYAIDIQRRAVNVGVVVTAPRPDPQAPIESQLIASIHPWFLGSLDENDVQGYAGTPVNVNTSLPDFLFGTATAGTVFATPGRYYVSVDSGRDPFTGRSLGGAYQLRSWVNDVKPPVIRLLTPKVSSGHPTLAFRATDALSGIDPLSISINYSSQLVGASFFDARTGVAVIPIPRSATELRQGRVTITLIAADNQETKNVNVVGKNIMPNTRIVRARLRVVAGPTIAWVGPGNRGCVSGDVQLAAVANSSALISSVGFFDGGREVGRVRTTSSGVYAVTWKTARLRKGKHTLTATVSDTRGREASAKRTVRVCA